MSKADEEGKDVPARVKSKRGHSSSSRGMNPLKTGNKDYDPLFDGESSPTVVGSSSNSERERLALKEADSEDEEERKRIAS